MHLLLRDQPLIAGIGRAWANEILHEAKLSPYALAPDLSLEEVERLATAIDAEPRAAGALASRARRTTRPIACTRSSVPCDATPIAQVDFEEHTIYYCPLCQTGGRVLSDPRLSRLPR